MLALKMHEALLLYGKKIRNEKKTCHYVLMSKKNIIFALGN